MEDIVAQHFEQLESFRCFSLIIPVEPSIIPGDGSLLLFGERVFYYYSDGDGEGIRLNGKEEGKWIYWDGKKIRDVEGYMKKGRPDGLWVMWKSDGTISEEGYFRDGDREGAWKNIYRNKIFEVVYRRSEIIEVRGNNRTLREVDLLTRAGIVNRLFSDL